MRRSTLLFFLVFSISTAQAEIPQRAFRDLERLTLRIFSQYSPKEYCYIGIGSSPTPLIALFQELGLPASNFPFSRSSLHNSKIKNEKPDTLAGKNIIKHFQHFTPSQTDPNSICYHRKILFIDYAHTGKSLSQFESALFFTKKHDPDLYKEEPYFLALTSRELPFQLLESNNNNYMELGSDLLHEMNHSAYDDVREFNPWLASMQKYSYAPQDIYRAFRKSIKRQFEADEKFATRLKAYLQSGEVKFSFCEKLLYILGY